MNLIVNKKAQKKMKDAAKTKNKTKMNELKEKQRFMMHKLGSYVSVDRDN